MPFPSFRANDVPAVFRQSILCLTLSSSAGLAHAATDTLDTVVVTASQTEHSELTAPASVSVITREQLDKMSVTTVNDAIKSLPGVNINPATSYGRNEIKIRGLDSDYTLLLINGQRINSRDALTSSYGNDFDLAAIPMAAVERIEVIRGALSSLYGADALGGVVNVILRQPTAQTEGALEYGTQQPTAGHSGDQHNASGYLSGSLIDDKLLGNVILDQKHKDAWQSAQTTNPNADASEKQEKTSLLSSLTWLIDDRQDLTFSNSYTTDDRTAHWNNYGATPTNIQQMDRLTLGLTHNGRWQLMDSQLRYFYEDVDLTDDSELNGAVADVTQQNHTLDGKLTGQFASHLLTAGGEYRQTRLQHSMNLTAGTAQIDQQAAYLQDEYQLGDLTLTLSGRLDHHETYGSEFSPRGYALYSLTDRWVIKGGVGKAFKAPTLAQSDEHYAINSCRGRCVLVGNPDLKPETAISYELGTAYEGERWGAGVTAFDNQIEQMIQAESWKIKPGAPVLTYQNVAEARLRGVEFMPWIALTERLDLTANYTFVQAKDETTGLDLLQTPRHTANLTLDWQWLDNLNAYTRYQYTGSQYLYVASANANQKSDAFHTLDVGTNYQPMEPLTLKLGLNNLTNTKRDTVAANADTILQGRTLNAGFAYQL